MSAKKDDEGSKVPMILQRDIPGGRTKHTDKRRAGLWLYNVCPMRDQRVGAMPAHRRVL